jgi:hypothetical protein
VSLTPPPFTDSPWEDMWPVLIGVAVGMLFASILFPL